METIRTRITMRSASEAERDIGQKLSDHCSRNDRDARSKSANAKLKRDYRRAQEAFGRIAQLYERKQQAELSLLTATGDGRMYNQQQAQAEVRTTLPKIEVVTRVAIIHTPAAGGLFRESNEGEGERCP